MSKHISEGMKTFNAYASICTPGFIHYPAVGKVLFCKGTRCGDCPVQVTKISACAITTAEFEELRSTNPEYMI
jgi:hypothetical protein